MYINIPGGFELVPLNRKRLDHLREATKKLEEMLADNEITASANDMIVTLYVPRADREEYIGMEHTHGEDDEEIDP